jgi:hypothetical protein
LAKKKDGKTQAGGEREFSGDLAAQDVQREAGSQEDLPGMENRAIQVIEETALKYAKVRDRRIALSLEENNLKTLLLAQMKDNQKREYSHAGIEIEIVSESETVKVRVKPTDTGKGDHGKQEGRKAKAAGVGTSESGQQPTEASNGAGVQSGGSQAGTETSEAGDF